MRFIRPFKKLIKIVYYEGINGLVIRARKRSSKFARVQLPDKSQRIREISEHLKHSQFVSIPAQISPPMSLQSARTNGKKKSLLMLIPPPERGSGGRMTMARIIRHLSANEFKCYVTFYPEVHTDDFSRCRGEWQNEFQFNDESCEVVPFNQVRQNQYDIAIATFWPSAFILKSEINARSKGYLVQDYEPFFYSPGSMYAFAEQSYRLGLWGICASPWLAKKLSSDFGMKTSGFLLGLQKNEYFLEKEVKREDNLVVAYIRQHTERRGYELIMWSLYLLKKNKPDVRIEIFGDERLPLGDFLWIDQNHGILSHGELRKLYNRATAGIVTSFTNYSLIPNEMMACGCAVVDLDTECMKMVYPSGAVSLCAPVPQSICASLEEILNDSEKRTRQVLNGLDYVSSLDWDKSLNSVADSIREFSNPTNSNGKA